MSTQKAVLEAMLAEQQKTNRFLIDNSFKLRRVQRSNLLVAKEIHQLYREVFRALYSEYPKESLGDDADVPIDEPPPPGANQVALNPNMKQGEMNIRHAGEVGGDQYFRVELAPKQWLLVQTDADMIVKKCVIEMPNGENVVTTPQEIVEAFGPLPIFVNVAIQPAGDVSHPTDRALNAEDDDDA